MTRIHQKETELYYLRKALNLLNCNDYCIYDSNGESPDFIIEIGNKKIGVEVTSIYRYLGCGNSAKTQSDLSFIVDKAVEIYNGKNGIPLVFGFAFDGRSAISNRSTLYQELGELIYEYTEKHWPDGINDIKKIDGKFTSFVNTIFAQPTDNADSVGFVVSSFDSEAVNNAALEKILRKKEVLLPKYRTRCEIIWLLIVLPTMRLAADYILLDNESIELDHNFDAVYVLDDYRNKVERVSKPNKSINADI